MKTSCPFRVTLAPFRATLASWGKTLGLLGPQEHATHATTASQNPPQVLDDVMNVLGDVMGLPRPTTWWKGHNPPGYTLAKLPLVERPPLLRCKLSDLSLPPAGVSTSIWWAFSPMEVRTNHLPMCTCPSGYLSVEYDPTNKQIRPPWAHKSQGS